MPMRLPRVWTIVIVLAIVISAFVAVIVVTQRCQLPDLIDRSRYDTIAKLVVLLGPPTDKMTNLRRNAPDIAGLGVAIPEERANDIFAIYSWRRSCVGFDSGQRILAIVDARDGAVLSIIHERSWI
jgi:hypothetical protein